MLVKRPTKNEAAALAAGDVDMAEGEEMTILEPLFVVFHMDGTNLSHQAISAMVQKMEDLSLAQKAANQLEVHDAILVTNAQPTNAFKKTISSIAPYSIQVF